VFVQRASAAAGVVAVVAAIGVSAVLLRQEDPSSGGVRVGVTQSPTWPDGWEVVTPKAANGECPTTPGPPLAEGDVPLLPEAAVKRGFVASIKTVTGQAVTVSYSNWQLNPPEQNAPRGIVVVDLPSGDQLQLQVGRFGDTPRKAADWWSAKYGHCAPLHRRVLADGTVLQLYPVLEADGTRPVQQVTVFRPDGRSYDITSTGTVKGKVPTTEAQLAALAQALIDNLG
jgi:hypothetical protein